MTSGISAPYGVISAGSASPTSSFAVPTDSQLAGAQQLNAAQIAAYSRRKKKGETDMRDPTEVSLDAEYRLEPITGTAPPAAIHKK